MALFLSDENVSYRFTDHLMARGHDALKCQEAGLAGMTDHMLIVATARAGRILISHNDKDFVRLQPAWRDWPAAWGLSSPPIHAGIILVEQRPPIEHEAIIVAIETLLADRPSITNELHRWKRQGWDWLG